MEHAPVDDSRRTAVVICPPLGYEDTSAYRPLRVLADAVAERGFTCVRVDWPGLGDSAGEALDDDILSRQVDALREVAESLRGRGFTQVLAIGVRAGGLLAVASAAFDALILWGCPASGKLYLREERAFHRLAARAFTDAPADRPALPEGVLEAGGFLYSAGSVRALDALSPAFDGPCLVIPREGTSARPELLAALGREVTVVEAGGVNDLLDDPYRAKLNPAARDAILGFLVGRDSFAPGPRAGRPDLRGEGWIERPVTIPCEAGQLVGIECLPITTPSAWTVLYNAGGVRRSGPNRLWTAAARVLAKQGIASLRVDVRDVGDADGAPETAGDLEAMYSEASVGDALRAYDHVDRGLPIDVVGLCSGAFMSVQVAARRPVRRATVFNCLAYVWDDDARSNGLSSQVSRSLLDGRRWKRLLTGRIDARALARALLVQARLRAEGLVARLRGTAGPDPVDTILRQVAARGTLLQVVISAGDPALDYLERHVPLARRPAVTLIPGVDHTLRPAWAHAAAIRLITAAPGAP